MSRSKVPENRSQAEENKGGMPRRTFIRLLGIVLQIMSISNGFREIVSAEAPTDDPESQNQIIHDRDSYQQELDRLYPDMEVVYVTSNEQLQEYYKKSLEKEIDECSFPDIDDGEPERLTERRRLMKLAADVLHTDYEPQELLPKLKELFCSVDIHEKARTQHNSDNLLPIDIFWDYIKSSEDQIASKLAHIEGKKETQTETYNQGLEGMKRVLYDYLSSYLNYPIRYAQYVISTEMLEGSKFTADNGTTYDYVTSLKKMFDVINRETEETKLRTVELRRVVVMPQNILWANEIDSAKNSGINNIQDQPLYDSLTDTSIQRPGSPATGKDPADVAYSRNVYQFILAPPKMTSNHWSNTSYEYFDEIINYLLDAGEIEEALHILFGLFDDYHYSLLNIDGDTSNQQNNQIRDFFEQNWNTHRANKPIGLSLRNIIYGKKGMHSMEGKMSLRNLLQAAIFMTTEKGNRIHNLTPFRIEGEPLSTTADGTIKSSLGSSEIDITIGESTGIIVSIEIPLGDQFDEDELRRIISNSTQEDDWKISYGENGEVRINTKINNLTTNLDFQDLEPLLAQLNSWKYLMIKTNQGNLLLPTQIIRDLRPGFKDQGENTGKFNLMCQIYDLDFLAKNDFMNIDLMSSGESLPIEIDFAIMTDDEINEARQKYTQNESSVDHRLANDTGQDAEIILYRFQLPFMTNDVTEKLGVTNDTRFSLVAIARKAN